MANRVFKLYTKTPSEAFAVVGNECGKAVVRRSGTKVGPSEWFFLTIVIEEPAAELFQVWLDRHAKRGQLMLELPYQSKSTEMRVEDAVWIEPQKV